MAVAHALLADLYDQDWHWLLLQTKPRQERQAVQHLGQRGVEPYCPMFLEPPWHRRAPRGPMPLFAGYLFVRCRPSRSLCAIRFCPGVRRPVLFNGRLATVEESFIEALREGEGDLGFTLPESFSQGIPEGRRVRVMGGPLRGMEGVFQGYLRGGERARILMEVLRAQKSVEVDAMVLRVALA